MSSMIGGMTVPKVKSYRVSTANLPPGSASLRPSFPLIDSFDKEEASRQFTCFKDLPTEIRVQVWRLACPVPRIVDIDLCPMNELGIGGYETPALLSVCQESRNFIRESWVQSFTTSQNPFGIYINPSKDYIHLRQLCGSFNACGNHDNHWNVERSLEKFRSLENIQNVILWEAQELAHFDGDSEYENYYQISVKFPALQKILTCVCREPWSQFFIDREEEELHVRQQLEGARHKHPTEMKDIKAPQIFAIRDCELKHMNWAEGGGFEPYWGDLNNRYSDVDPADGFEEMYFDVWQSRVQNNTLSELSEGEIGACLQDFCRMTDELQVLHGKELCHLEGKDDRGGDADKQEAYLRSFYNIEGPCREWAP